MELSHWSGVEEEDWEGEGEGEDAVVVSTGMFAVGIPSSLLPRPKPAMTGPDIRSGKGGTGPVGGPTRRGRPSVIFEI